MFLESGDIVLMTGVSRLQYHGVPKIIPSESKNWSNFNDVDNKPADASTENCDHVTFDQVENPTYWAPFARYIDGARVNLNVRQVNFHDITS